MRRAFFVFFLVCSACSEGAPAAPADDGWVVDEDPATGDENDDQDGDLQGDSDADDSPGDGDSTVDPNGLPCEVRDMLAAYCVSCHRAPPIGGAHFPLRSASDLRQTSQGSSLGDQAVQRLRDTGSARMPPTGARPTSAQIDAFAAWVSDGMPPGECDGDIDAGVAMEDPAFTGETVCTSGISWLLGDFQSEFMHPGLACIDCHTDKGEGPSLSIAGTVYATGHEPDDCDGVNGASAGVQVIVKDADGKEVTLVPNLAGNFLSEERVRFPITARVTYQGRERAMVEPSNTGDCNSCHTEQGNEDAPGRIALP